MFSRADTFNEFISQKVFIFKKYKIRKILYLYLFHYSLYLLIICLIIFNKFFVCSETYLILNSKVNFAVLQFL